MTIDELMARRPEVEFDVSLTSAQCEQFRECGFTSIARITTDEELAWLGEIYDRMFAERINPVPGAFVDIVRPNGTTDVESQKQILLPELRFPELRKTAFWRNDRRLASILLGLELTAVRGWGHMIRKPPRDSDNGALPWHQDEAYWDRSFKHHATSCWMPLDPATVESGCMSFIPGSHRSGVREHLPTGGDFATHGYRSKASIRRSRLRRRSMWAARSFIIAARSIPPDRIAARAFAAPIRMNSNSSR